MASFLGTLGAVVLLVSLVDMAWTTVAVSVGGGPVTSRLAHGHWLLWRAAARRADHPHRVLRVAGIIVVVSMLLTWVSAVWLGWSLVFNSAPSAVRDATTQASAGALERVYFAGYTMLTLGNGGLVPGPGIWQILTVVASFTGLAVVTMGITYLVPIVSAVVQGRTLALHITALGTDPYDILTSTWRQDGWESLTRGLETLTPELMMLGQRHLAYPVLHYFHNTDERAAPAVAVATLDEALSLLEFGVAEDARPDRVSIRLARNGIGSLLGALRSAFMTPADEPPAPLSLEPLRDAGVPTVAAAEFHEACRQAADHRREVRGLVEDAGWSWDRVVEVGAPEEATQRDGPWQLSSDGRADRNDGDGETDTGGNVQSATERSA